MKRTKRIPKLATLILIPIITLALIGLTYSHWQETLQIQGTIHTATQDIKMLNCNPPPQLTCQCNPHTRLIGQITPNETITTEITIKNTGTTPATITYHINTNNSELWNNYFEYSQNPTDDYELTPGSTIPIEQRITLNGDPQEPFTIEVTITYIATFQSWTDTVTITYTLTYNPPEPQQSNSQTETQNTNDQSTSDSDKSAEPDNQPPDTYNGENPEANSQNPEAQSDGDNNNENADQSTPDSGENAEADNQPSNPNDSQNNETPPNNNNNNENTSQETENGTIDEPTAENNSESVGGEDITENGGT